MNKKTSEVIRVKFNENITLTPSGETLFFKETK